MNRIVALALLLIGAATYSFAPPPAVPEIDAAAGANAVALLAGALLVFRSRRSK